MEFVVRRVYAELDKELKILYQIEAKFEFHFLLQWCR